MRQGTADLVANISTTILRANYNLGSDVGDWITIQPDGNSGSTEVINLNQTGGMDGPYIDVSPPLPRGLYPHSPLMPSIPSTAPCTHAYFNDQPVRQLRPQPVCSPRCSRPLLAPRDELASLRCHRHHAADNDGTYYVCFLSITPCPFLACISSLPINRANSIS